MVEDIKSGLPISEQFLEVWELTDKIMGCRTCSAH